MPIEAPLASGHLPGDLDVDLNTTPSFITKPTFFSSLTSARGSPATAITSAYAPGATTPSSPLRQAGPQARGRPWRFVSEGIACRRQNRVRHGCRRFPLVRAPGAGVCPGDRIRDDADAGDSVGHLARRGAAWPER